MTTQLAPDTVLDVYARVSRKGDDRQRSTDGQVDDCRARIADLGAALGRVHVDPGKSAWNPKAKRTEWNTLMDRLESGATGGVVVFDLARFSRRPIEGERLIAAAERGLVILDSESEYDLTTANGKKQFRDQLNNAAYESDRLSTRVKRGKKIKAMNGETNASRRPFGFKAEKVIKEITKEGKTETVLVWDYTQVDETEAAIIREVAKRLLTNKESHDGIVRWLNSTGVLTSTGKRWTSMAVRSVMIRPINAGIIEYNGVEVSKLPGEETILTRDVWERVCSHFAAKRRGRPVSNIYLATGIAHCGVCGHSLSGRPRPQKRAYADGEVRREYWCQPRAHGAGCGKIAIDQRGLDEHVKALVIGVLSDPRHSAAVEAAIRVAADRRQQIEAEISDLEQLATELSGRLGRREISLTRYDAATAPLDRQLTELRERLTELDTMPEAVGPETNAASQAEWEQRWTDASVTERRSLLRQALGGDRLEIDPADSHDRTDVAKRFVVRSLSGSSD